MCFIYDLLIIIDKGLYLTQRLEPAYILHTRYFRDTSLIVELFTQHEGTVAVLAKGARKQARWKGLLQLFAHVLVAWRGKSELPILTGAEPGGDALILQGDALFSGFYLNELLIRLLHKHDPHPRLFNVYQQTLAALNQGEVEKSLRCFEKQLLQELGYGLVLDRELENNTPIDPASYYQYHLEQGARKVTGTAKATDIYQGKSLLALHHDQLITQEARRDAKRLMRQAIAILLNHKPLKSRELFTV